MPLVLIPGPLAAESVAGFPRSPHWGRVNRAQHKRGPTSRLRPRLDSCRRFAPSRTSFRLPLDDPFVFGGRESARGSPPSGILVSPRRMAQANRDFFPRGRSSGPFPGSGPLGCRPRIGVSTTGRTHRRQPVPVFSGQECDRTAPVRKIIRAAWCRCPPSPLLVSVQGSPPRQSRSYLFVAARHSRPEWFLGAAAG